MENLWEETIRKLELYDKTFDDVKMICGDEFQITKEDFRLLADEPYDSGFGTQEVARDLMIVGDDWWMERHQYDGSEWWEFKQMPPVDLPFRKVKRLIGGFGTGFFESTLAEMNEGS